ncbi:SMR family transporter, partial [Aeromonas caviae]|uniref:DMT family transporter n=1 Tax=Aeromonas caviae TaxID=648 RepID=UPI00214EB2C1
MKGWLFLVIAIVGEVIATSALKSSEGFTKLAPSAVVIIGYLITHDPQPASRADMASEGLPRLHA